MAINDVTLEEIAAIRNRIDVEARRSPTVEAGAQRFVSILVEQFPTIALARVFLVVPYALLPKSDREFAAGVAARVDSRRPLDEKTRVLSLLGTRGTEPRWNERVSSTGHLAIPLLDRQFVQSTPMLAQLLSHLEVEFAGLDEGRPIAPRQLLGGKNLRFYVPDAATTRDEQGRHVIPTQSFVAKHRIKTVFGMGGAYYDGTLAVAVLFSQEAVDVGAVDRFPSLISTFKMATTHLVTAQRIYGAGV